MLIRGEVVSIEGDTLRAIITNKERVLEVAHSRTNEELCNFETITILEKDQALFDFDPYSNLM